ncbi:MAG TPA: class I SAM-dependent methyltransferase [Kofleriaceae bacterium]|nr:class I SAM-dependent methyltransferase [Kofleriaceae bacterium]
MTRPHFFEAWAAAPVSWSDEVVRVGDAPIMYGWERPLMEAYAEAICRPDRDLLEIGFGMGIFAEAAARRGLRSHTIVEPHPEILPRAHAFAATGGGRVQVIADYWQRCQLELATYDAIFYDSWSPEETRLDDLRAFFTLAAIRLLRPGGLLAFWVPGSTLGEAMQAVALARFDSLSLTAVRGLEPSAECRERGFGSTMLVAIAAGPRRRTGSQPR